MKKILLIATALVFSFSFSKSFADGHGPEIYGPYPITLKGYEGDETNISTDVISYISPLWTYKLLTILSFLMIVGEIILFLV